MWIFVLKGGEIRGFGGIKFLEMNTACVFQNFNRRQKWKKQGRAALLSNKSDSFGCLFCRVPIFSPIFNQLGQTMSTVVVR